MIIQKFFRSIVGMVLLISISCTEDDKKSDDTGSGEKPGEITQEEIVISANRVSGNISFIDAVTDEVVETLDIEGSEPMYVVYVSETDKIYVGDRKKDVVHIVNPSTKKVTGEIAVGKGVFHMWADNMGKTLWVNNDIDKTTSVIDLATEKVIKTIDLGGKPHDVFFNADDTKAFVSILEGDETVADSIFSYDTTSYMKLKSVAVGDDPHLFYLNSLKKLYVPNQTGGVDVMDDDLNKMKNIPIDGSHGIFSRKEKDVFVADLPGTELHKVDGETDASVGMPLTTPVVIPHNLTINEMNSKLYVTHSGAMADKLTVYSIEEDDKIELVKTLTVGTNPFGIVYYKRSK